MRRHFLATTLLASALVAAPAVTRPSLVVLNKGDNEMVIIDLTTNTITGRVPVGLGPHEVVTSTDGATAFVANYGDGPNPGSTISVIDLDTLKERRRVDVSPMRRPHGLAFADGKLYFTSETSRVVARYDPAANVIDWIIGTGQTSTHMVYATTDGRTLYTANIGGNSLSVIERGANPAQATVTTIPVGKGPEGFDVRPTAHSCGRRTRRTAECRSSTSPPGPSSRRSMRRPVGRIAASSRPTARRC